MRTGHGIILRLTKLTETSLIVTWCVEGVGLVKTVAKGARRPKSAFAGKLDLFYSAELSWVPSAKSELGTLRELVVAEYAEGIRKIYKNTMVAGYFATLLEYVMEAGEVDDDAYGLLVRAYRYLTEKPVEWKAVVHFEKELTILLGVWDGKSQPHLCLRRAFGGLPKNRTSCEDLFRD
ncbi:MAG: DNA repair protein RecO [Akkermansiaceae bacterium]